MLRDLSGIDATHSALAALRRDHETLDAAVKRAIAERVAELVRAAREAMQRKDFAEAKRRLDEAATLDPVATAVVAATRELAAMQRHKAIEDQPPGQESKREGTPVPGLARFVGNWVWASPWGPITLAITGVGPRGTLLGRMENPRYGWHRSLDERPGAATIRASVSGDNLRLEFTGAAYELTFAGQSLVGRYLCPTCRGDRVVEARFVRR
jgi:hypothetical protein